jgi:DNA polymerase-3 subunit epsilon
VHGALLDAHLLADVWVAMTAGQGALALGLDGTGVQTEAVTVAAWDASVRPRVLHASEADNAAHGARLAAIDKVSAGSLWKREEEPVEP